MATTRSTRKLDPDVMIIVARLGASGSLRECQERTTLDSRPAALTSGKSESSVL